MNNKIDRKIALDIETTGLNNSGLLYKNHKIIEIGAIEIIDRKITNNNFHVYLNPEREINNEAFKIHGISNKFLIDKPIFADIYSKFIEYISNSDIIAHNANFDISFINYEIKKLGKNFKYINTFCKVIDTLELARNIFPGKKNNLDALCNRYNINHKSRKIHSAELDALLVAKIYLRMTCLQKKLYLDNITNFFDVKKEFDYTLKTELKILKASNCEKEQHKRYLKYMEKLGNCLWMN